MRELELVVSAGDQGSYLVSARSTTGDTPQTPTMFPFDDRGLARRLQDTELALAKSAAITRRLAGGDERPIQEFGRELFAFLFPDRVRDHFSAERTQAARDGTSVQIRLRIRPPELAALPWELLYDPASDDYLCLSTPVVRYLEVFQPAGRLAVIAPLRVLGMVARPGALSDLDVEREKRWLHDALAGLAVELAWAGGQTWRDLQDGLDRTSPHVVHFIGHGSFDADRAEGILALAGEDGGVHRMPASSIALMLSDHRALRLVVLNSCEGARASPGDVFSSTAAALTRRGIPAVVAMQYDISDQAAIAFARDFYGAIASGLGVDQAVTRARRGIKFSRDDTLEWATPVLYLRSPDACLFDLTTAAAPAVTAPQEPERPPAETTPPGPSAELAGQVRKAPEGPSAHGLPRRPGPAHPAQGSLAVVLEHDAQVLAVAFSPDGALLATGSGDNAARIWNTATGQEVTRMAHGGRVLAVAFSPDGAGLATGCGDKAARIWNTATGQEITRLAHKGAGTWVRSVAFSPDGARLATGSDDKVARIWDIATGQEITRLAHKGVAIWVRSVAFSPDGARLATGSDDQAVRIWDAATGREISRLAHGGRVLAVAFSPDGALLATGSADKTARIWDAATGREIFRLAHGGPVNAVAFSPDGARLATGSSDKTVQIRDTATGREIFRLAHGGPVNAVACSPDGARLATGSDDKIARIWAV